MSIQTQTGKAVYVADGNTTTFSVPFYFFAKEIAVYAGKNQAPLIEGSDYTLTRFGENGGEIVFFTAPVADTIITIVRNVEMTQLIKFIEGENFPASDYEYALDKIVMGLQQLKSRLEECVTFPHGLTLNAEEVASILTIINDNIESIELIPEMLSEIADLRSYLATEFAKYYTKTEVDAQISAALPLKFSNVSVDVSGAVSDATYADYPYHIDVALAGVQSTHIPEIIFNVEQAISGNFAPIASIYNGAIRLYMKEIPESNFTLASVIMH